MDKTEVQEIVKQSLATEKRRQFKKKLILVATTAIFAPVFLYAASIAIPNTFSEGDTLSAGKLNDNFSTLLTKANDNDTRISALENKTPQSFCTTVANGNTNNVISCPVGKKFIGLLLGGVFTWVNGTAGACPTTYGASAIPTPNLRIDDDSDGTPNSILWATFGCNGVNSCTVNNLTPGVNFLMGTCM